MKLSEVVVLLQSHMKNKYDSFIINSPFFCFLNYAQAFHIDWATFQNCPINVQIFQIFYGKFENCPINVQNYPINVKCLRTYIAQAFHIDWAVLKFLAFFWHFLKKNLILPNQCEMLAHIYSASISH